MPWMPKQLNLFSKLKVQALVERPLSDPVIVHVTGFEQAKQYYDVQDFTIIQTLAQAFWPGPLTIVAKANLKLIPDVCCANTGCVGIRCPNNQIALQLIKESGLPIAAPSANKFGHVSPSQASHVYADFIKEDLTILDGGQCSFGIESTVCKIEDGAIAILRKGGISESMLLKVATPMKYKVYCKSHVIEMASKESQISPGQYIRHYSPNIPTYMMGDGKKLDVTKCAIIDLGKTLVHLKGKAIKYTDLSEKGDVLEAIGNIYNALREAECFTDANAVLISDLIKGAVINKEHLASLSDRIYRAASGSYATISSI
jgi:tRNA threonylcarbamoyl adenosine modification protein (Sua5/YciO/YrdC/YwlC family)